MRISGTTSVHTKNHFSVASGLHQDRNFSFDFSRLACLEVLGILDKTTGWMEKLPLEPITVW